ncbi:MAG: DUF72 domain-containing protein [Burkholderiales bacterium]|nr:DUF72 domain-containing protein [Burkholderiales bacterium]
MAKSGRIRVGIGGWTFDPWRETFYPPDLTQKRELEYASRHVTAIEINGTYYRTQKPESFARWRDETPNDFVFSLKAPRYATNRKVLAEAGESIARFMTSGLTELGDKLGPILWQFAPTKRFEPEDFAKFLALLPADIDGRRLRHVLEVRHTSFAHVDFIALARRYHAAIVFTDSNEYPSLADLTSGFVYARLVLSDASIDTGYSKDALTTWADRARIWAGGGEPADLPRVGEDIGQNASIAAPRSSHAKRSGGVAVASPEFYTTPLHLLTPTLPSKWGGSKPRDVFIFMINGAKERAPAAAQQLLSCLN